MEHKNNNMHIIKSNNKKISEVILQKQKAAYKEGIISIVINIILFVLKYMAGTITGSIAIIADGWHSLSDSLTSFIVIISAKMASKPPDKKHPFGHGRIELVSSVIIGALLAFTGYELGQKAIAGITHKTEVIYTTFAIIITVISIIVKEVLAQIAFYYYRKTGSKTIKADGWHHRTDALSSIIVLIGIFITKKIIWIDNVMGVLIAGLIIFTAFQIIKETSDKIIGEAPEENLINEIKKTCVENAGEKIEPHHFHIHSYGEHKELTFHINLPGGITLFEAHDTIKILENVVYEKYHMEATIHGDVLENIDED